MNKNYLVSNYEDSFDLWDPFFRGFFDFPFEKEVHRNNLMRADVSEDDDKYHIDIELPAIKKENVKLELNNGYLTIHASSKSNKEELNKHGKVIRQERFCGNFSRTFYVGKDVEEKDISASLNDGVLSLDIQKVEAKKEKKRFIEIK